MSKKKTEELAAETPVTEAPAAEETKAETKADKPVKADKPADKNEKKKVDKNKKPNIFKRMWRKLREVFGELKKVTWPTFGKTVGQTGVVLVVVLFFTVIFGLANAGLLELYKLLIQHFGGGSSALVTLLALFGA